MTQLDRRHFLIGAAAAGVAAVVRDPLEFAYADAGDKAHTLSGHIVYGAPDWVYVPVRVPAGVNRITVSYSYDKPAPPPGYDGNALDIGVFDEGGIELGNAAGFRSLVRRLPHRVHHRRLRRDARLRCCTARSADAWSSSAAWSDHSGEFGERCGEPQRGAFIDCEFVVAAA